MLLAVVQPWPEGNQPTDAALMERVLQRDPAALETLYDRYGRPVYSLVLRIAQQPASAEEIVQDVFLQLWRSAERFQASRGRLEPWLFTMARNRALDFLRLKREKQRRREDSTDSDIPFSVVMRPDPEGDIDQSRRAEKVRAVMSSLPDAQRRAIELAFFEGMSHSEISAATGEALGTVKSWIRGGLLRLRESLGGGTFVMDCEQLAPFYEEYALGILEGDERAEVETHLARACPTCTPGVAKARWLVAQLAFAAPDAKLPPALRGKIMDEVRSSTDAPRTVAPLAPPAPKRAMFPAWAWAAAAALALVTGYTIHQIGVQTAQLAELRREMNLATLQSQALQNQLDQGRMIASIMMSPDSMPLKLMPKDKNMPMVHAYVHPHMGVAITADQMPSLSPKMTLQLWFVPKTGKPMSVAIFHPDAQGEVAVVAPVNMPMNEIAMLAVTEEPAGGSPQPTSSPTWMAQVN